MAYALRFVLQADSSVCSAKTSAGIMQHSFPMNIRDADHTKYPIRWQLVPVGPWSWRLSGSALLRHSRTQAGVWASFIVMFHPRPQGPSQVPFAHWDHEIQTLASYSSDHPFAICICLRCAHRRAQYSQSEAGLEFFVQLRREDRITVMNQELVRTVIRKGFPKLLQRPVCRRMSGHVVMENAAAANLHHEEDKQHLESDRDCNQEITGHDPSGVILDEGPPVLRRGSSTSNTARWLGPILAHGARRNIDAQL